MGIRYDGKLYQVEAAVGGGVSVNTAPHLSDGGKIREGGVRLLVTFSDARFASGTAVRIQLNCFPPKHRHMWV